MEVNELTTTGRQQKKINGPNGPKKKRGKKMNSEEREKQKKEIDCHFLAHSVHFCFGRPHSF
jgi:hypothetical protein